MTTALVVETSVTVNNTPNQHLTTYSKEDIPPTYDTCHG